jgi:hypothetical protein
MRVGIRAADSDEKKFCRVRVSPRRAHSATKESIMRPTSKHFGLPPALPTYDDGQSIGRQDREAQMAATAVEAWDERWATPKWANAHRTAIRSGPRQSQSIESEDAFVTRRDHPQSRLTALLDALERELLATQADEVRHACRKAGRARDIACQEVRTLLNEAIAASEEGSAATLPPDTCIGPDRHLGVSRGLQRARAFAMAAIDQVRGARAAFGRGRYSLWTGDLGLAVYLWHCTTGEPQFPTIDVL